MASTLNPAAASLHGSQVQPQANINSAQLERTITHLERSSDTQDADSVLLPALQVLLKQTRTIGDQKLTVRVQRLVHRVGMQGNHNSTPHSTRAQPLISTSAMGRFLHDSIQRQSSANVKLPPVPQLVVDANIKDDYSARLEEHDEEQDGMAEYEHASSLRRRKGYGQDDSQQDSGNNEKGRSPTPPPQTHSGHMATATADRATHENLSSELLRMASALRTQSISFSEALERDRKLLESTDEHLAKNLDLMTRTRGRLGEYAHKARGMGWLTLGTIIVVILIWVVMFVIIKLT